MSFPVKVEPKHSTAPSETIAIGRELSRGAALGPRPNPSYSGDTDSARLGRQRPGADKKARHKLAAAANIVV